MLYRFLLGHHQLVVFFPTGSPFEICRLCPEHNDTSRCGFTKEVGQECVKDPRGSDLSPTSSLSPYLFLCRGAVKTNPVWGDLLSHLLVGTGTTTICVVTSSCESSKASEQVREAGVSSFSENRFVRAGVSCFLPSSAKTRQTEFSKLQKIYLYVLSIFFGF